MKLAVIREGKVPPDKRVPLTPAQCVEVQQKFPNVEVIVQTSEVRAFKDEEYASLGLPVVEDISDCDILIGVKEVPIKDLIPNKKYMFFSHTFKEQPYNRDLLRAILDKKIQLIDYETLTDKNENRIIGFGRYAGIVGCYNGFLAYGAKTGLYQLKPANACEDRKELEAELKKVKLPAGTKIVATGFGRVGNGAREIFTSLGLKEVSPEDFLDQEFDEAVFTHLKAKHYYGRADGKPFDRLAFFESGEGHVSTFDRYLKEADMYIAAHYWDASSPFIISREDLKMNGLRTKVVADISCDIDGPVACTIRPSTIAKPIYGYNPSTESEVDPLADGAICVMAVDNLPCELPKDASEDFGGELINEVFPYLFGEDPDRIIERASETNLEGELMPDYSYLEDYVAGN
ncbi:NAD(P)-dependent oxidoreductase [Paracrocinitomix mangrovi]|nr:NAD(P)-dependent oxidoreductase [Paracrocinitomix mangrovi]UKN03837.1 NAD(P)-dependent oxidoreductase [Paracrocinitomix mangrovi]